MDRIGETITNLIKQAHRPRRLTWREKHPTVKQRIILVDAGYRVPPTRGAAYDLIATFQDWEPK